MASEVLHGGKALDGLGSYQITKPNQTLNAADSDLGRQAARAKSVAKRERAQTAVAKVPKSVLSGKGWGHTDSQEVGLEAAIL